MTVADMIKLLQQLPFHDVPLGMYDLQGNYKRVEIQISSGGFVVLAPMPGDYITKRKVANAG